MPCGAILTFDLITEAAVRQQWQAIASAGLPSLMPGKNYSPHLTLAVCEDMDLEAMRESLPALTAAFAPLVVDFPGFGVFSDIDPVVYMAVTRSPMLSALHAAFWEIISPNSTSLSPYYRPRSWFPHVTLNQGMPLALAGAVIDTLLRTPRPATGLLLDLHIVDFENGLPRNYSAQLGTPVE